MGLFNRLLKKLTNEEAMRNANFLKSLYRYTTTGVTSLQYQNLEQLIDEGFKRNVDVFSVINWIAENAANIPLRVERLVGDKYELDPNSELQKLIDRPNPYQSGLEHRHQAFGFYQTTGNTFIYAPRLEEGINQGQTKEMWIMPSQYTEIFTGGWMNPIAGYGLNMFGGDMVKFKYDDVMHMKTLQLDFGDGREFYGMSPLRAGLMALDRSNSNYTAASTSYKTMGMAGILSVKDGESFEPTMSPEQQSQEQERLDEQYMGVFNNGKTMVTNADVTYSKLGLSPVDLNLLADKKATLRDFCNIYGISSVLFNDNENSTYNNVSEAKKSAYNDVINPLVNRYVQELNQWLVPSYGEEYRIKADFSDVAVLQTDKKEQSEWLVNEIREGLRTRNEGREILGLDAVEDEAADKLTVNAGTLLLEDIVFDPMIESSEAAKKLGKHYLKK